MKIELKEIPIREVFNGYVNNDEEGVVGFGGLLNIRPKYQREFIYDDARKKAVISTIIKNFPLNVMYWVKNEDGSFEVLDGQQRTISFCQYVNGDFSVDSRGFSNLTEFEKEQILNYPLMVYICEGNDKEKLEWFETINIAGLKLTDQELRNAIYNGPWVTDAKRYFSKSHCAAYQIGSKLLNGSPIRQDYLEKAIEWAADRDNMKSVKDFMAVHQHNSSASDLWLYYSSVINWVNTLFVGYRSHMKGIEWGILYNKYKDTSFNPQTIEEIVKKLMMDDEVEAKKGIYYYIFDGKQKHLSLRQFSNSQRTTMFERQNGVCPLCSEKFEINQMEGDHIKPWSQGGKTELSNGQMLCFDCNREKSNK